MTNKRILLAGNNSESSALLEKMLMPYGFQTIKVENGEEAVGKTKELLPDLIILNWDMPGMDGMQVLETIKGILETKDIPVVMIAGRMTLSEDFSKAITLGVSEFVCEPFEKEELIVRINNQLLLSSSLKKLEGQKQELTEKDDFIASLIQSTFQPVLYYDIEGIIRLHNDLFLDIFSADKEQLVGKSIYRFFPPEEAGFHVQKDNELIKKGGKLSYERKLFDNGPDVIISKSLIRNRSGEAIGIVTGITNISKIKKTQENLLNSKNKELLAGALQSLHTSNLNNYLVDEILKLKPYTNDEGRKIIQDIHNKFKVSLTSQIWSNIEKRVGDSFNAFNHALLSKFPNLSPTDRKLCTLLRLGLSSKDIAEMTFTNPQSVDVARYRLRKKLNLSSEDNLTNFLITLDDK